MEVVAAGSRPTAGQRRAIVLANLVGLLAVFVTCHAQPTEPKSVPRHFGEELTAINACVRQVRQATTAGSRFDAHLTARGTMRYAGTDSEIAAFKRCMQAKGFPTEPN
jgi:hypothetical protein